MEVVCYCYRVGLRRAAGILVRSVWGLHGRLHRHSHLKMLNDAPPPNVTQEKMNGTCLETRQLRVFKKKENKPVTLLITTMAKVNNSWTSTAGRLHFHYKCQRFILWEFNQSLYSITSHVLHTPHLLGLECWLKCHRERNMRRQVGFKMLLNAC